MQYVNNITNKGYNTRRKEDEKLILMVAIMATIIYSAPVEFFNSKGLKYVQYNSFREKDVDMPITMSTNGSYIRLFLKGTFDLILEDYDFGSLRELLNKAIRWDSIATVNKVANVTKTLGTLNTSSTLFEGLDYLHSSNNDLTLTYGKSGKFSFIGIHGILISNTNRFMKHNTLGTMLMINQVKQLLPNITIDKLNSYRKEIELLETTNDNLFN